MTLVLPLNKTEGKGNTSVERSEFARHINDNGRADGGGSEEASEQRESVRSCSECSTPDRGVTKSKRSTAQEHVLKIRAVSAKATDIRAHDSAIDTTGYYDTASSDDSDSDTSSESSRSRLRRSTSQSSVESGSSSSSTESWDVDSNNTDVKRWSSLDSIGSQASSEADSALSTTEDDSSDGSDYDPNTSCSDSEGEDMYTVDDQQADLLSTVQWTTFEDLVKILQVNIDEDGHAINADPGKCSVREEDNLQEKGFGKCDPKEGSGNSKHSSSESGDINLMTRESETTNIIMQAFLIATNSPADDLEISILDSEWNRSLDISQQLVSGGDSHVSGLVQTAKSEDGDGSCVEDTPKLNAECGTCLDRRFAGARRLSYTTACGPVETKEAHTSDQFQEESTGNANQMLYTSIFHSAQSCCDCTESPSQGNHANENGDCADENCDSFITGQLRELCSDREHVMYLHDEKPKSCSTEPHSRSEESVSFPGYTGSWLLSENLAESPQDSEVYVQRGAQHDHTCPSHFSTTTCKETPSFEEGGPTLSRISLEDSSTTSHHLSPGIGSCLWPFCQTFTSPGTQAVVDESAEASRWLEEHSVDSSTYSPMILTGRGPPTFTFGRYFTSPFSRLQSLDEESQKLLKFSSADFLHQQDSSSLDDFDLLSSASRPASPLTTGVDKVLGSYSAVPIDNEISFGFTERL